MASDWLELIVLHHIRQPCIAHASKQLDSPTDNGPVSETLCLYQCVIVIMRSEDVVVSRLVMKFYVPLQYIATTCLQDDLKKALH